MLSIAFCTLGMRHVHERGITLAQKTIEKGSSEWLAFMDIWDIYKKVGNPEEDAQYWHDLVWKHANGYLEKYKTIPEYPIFRNMIVGMCEGLDEMIRNEGE